MNKVGECDLYSYSRLRMVNTSVLIIDLRARIYYALFRRGVPYFGALVSHLLIGDYFTSYGCKLFWPVFSGWYRSSVAISYAGHFGMGVEIILFMFMLLLMVRNYIARVYVC